MQIQSATFNNDYAQSTSYAIVTQAEQQFR